MIRCINKLRPEILKEDITAEYAQGYLKKNTSEVYEMPEGFTIKGITILGKPPLYVGLKNKRKEIVFYFHKPCFGISLYKVKAGESDLENVRETGRLLEK